MSEQEKESGQKTFVLKSKSMYLWLALAAGVVFDILFWDKEPGISIPIFFLVVLGIGFYLAQRQGLKASRGALLLVVPIVFFAVMSFIRVEPMTVFLNVTAALALMALFAHSFLGGQWWQYGFKDHFLAFLFISVDALFRQIGVFTQQPKQEAADPDEEQPGGRPKLRTALAVLRGLLIALPIVLVFGAMLAEADPVFKRVMGDFLDVFDIENLDKYIGQAIVACLIAYLLLGVYLHAFYKNHDAGFSSDESKRLLPRFLGFTESAIILSSVNLLFLVFVVVQFQYFFGGDTNINVEGFTYAEYARRGFGELVAVAFFSLLLFMGLSFLTKKSEKQSQSVFSGLGIALLAMVSVILVSSFQRLTLLEAAYGFTRLRAYSHVFIFWLGALLAIVIVLELIRQSRFFALVTMIACMGFVVTLDVMNVDGFIVRQNVGRMAFGGAEVDQSEGRGYGKLMDVTYLASLSEDALPVLAELYESEENEAVQENIQGAIACHAFRNDKYDRTDQDWQSFKLSPFQARQAWERLNADYGDVFGVLEGEIDSDYSYSQYYVMVNGEEVPCFEYYWD